MIDVLFNFLNNNQEIINLIGENRIFPLFTTDLTKPSLVYNWKQGKKNLTLYESTLSLNIIWSNFDLIMEIENLLTSLLDFISKTQFCELEGYLFNSIRQGGGLYVYNSKLKTYEKTINFTITWKEV